MRFHNESKDAALDLGHARPFGLGSKAHSIGFFARTTYAVDMTRKSQTTNGIPRFFLYGDSEEVVDDRFLHIETIEARSRACEWRIRPHSHASLHHLFFVLRGSVEVLVETERFEIDACALIIPAGVVHGFRWSDNTDGYVITVSERLVSRLIANEPALALLFDFPQAIELAKEPITTEQLRSLLIQLEREFSHKAPLGELSKEALFSILLVAAHRLAIKEGRSVSASPRRAAMIVARYRQQIEKRLLEGWTVLQFAKALGTSTTRLRAYCIEVTGMPPIKLLHDRLLSEARRQLAHTNRSISEISYALGYDDPAYFTRFFKQRIGCTPIAFRIAQESGTSEFEITDRGDFVIGEH